MPVDEHKHILHRMVRLLVLGCAGFIEAIVAMPMRADPEAFARSEIVASARRAGVEPPPVTLTVDPRLGPQDYRFQTQAGGGIGVVGGPVGAMYGGLDLAEAIRLGPDAVRALAADPLTHTPFVAERGIKFNLPLDLRTPSYADDSDSARANIPEVWSRDFWSAYFDEMARDRYNVLSLWNLHPFPSMVRVPEFPAVALDDVWRSRRPLGPATFDLSGRDAVPPAFLADREVVKRITIDQKIAFWQEVMRMAADRGISVYIFTWNIFSYGTGGRYGITDDATNPATIAYLRSSVRALVDTDPLLAGVGFTAGENMKGVDNDAKEQWLWSTYGEGMRDALKDNPGRAISLIHRYHETKHADIVRSWSRYPGYPASFSYSYKYSIAHMYSSAKPPFIAEVMPYLKEGSKTWLEVRNDDIYSFRWGDPDYSRQYLLNLPPKSELAGFFMGPDGFTWGRDFLDRDLVGHALGPNRPLVMQKQVYAFMLWGRLAYDPNLPDTHFQRVLGAWFPGVDALSLFEASSAASRVIPQITRFFWGGVDLAWFPEACVRNRHGSHFYTVAEFMKGKTMPGAGFLTIREWRQRRLGRLPEVPMLSPLDAADALAGDADTALRLIAALRSARGPVQDRELRLFLGDDEAMSLLGRYYAEKIRGACDLALYDASGRADQKASAVAHLERALEDWKRYAAVRDAQYLPGFYSRIGWIDISALTQEVAKDVDLARNWTPGSLD